IEERKNPKRDDKDADPLKLRTKVPFRCWPLRREPPEDEREDGS
ncbi:unnamed protein product, partial [Larinioides sclopetarius]